MGGRRERGGQDVTMQAPNNGAGQTGHLTRQDGPDRTHAALRSPVDTAPAAVHSVYATVAAAAA